MLGKVKYFNRIKHNKKLLFLVLFLTFAVNAYSQASWSGWLLFNLVDISGYIVTPENVLSQNIQFYTYGGVEIGFITYDSDKHCFVYGTHGPSVTRFLRIASGDRMVEIIFPAFRRMLFFTDNIIIDNLTYNFNNIEIDYTRAYYSEPIIYVTTDNVTVSNKIAERHGRDLELIEFNTRN
jgi:hypothetical protein